MHELSIKVNILDTLEIWESGLHPELELNHGLRGSFRAMQYLEKRSTLRKHDDELNLFNWSSSVKLTWSRNPVGTLKVLILSSKVNNCYRILAVKHLWQLPWHGSCSFSLLHIKLNTNKKQLKSEIPIGCLGSWNSAWRNSSLELQ